MKKHQNSTKQKDPKKSKQPKNKENKSRVLNTVAGVTIGAAIGGLAGVALSDKKTRKVFGNAVFEFVRSVLDGIEKINIDSSDK